MERIFALNINGDLIYRIPGFQHGDGQVDDDDSPVWLLAFPEMRDWVDVETLPIIDNW